MLFKKVYTTASLTELHEVKSVRIIIKTDKIGNIFFIGRYLLVFFTARGIASGGFGFNAI